MHFKISLNCIFHEPPEARMARAWARAYPGAGFFWGRRLGGWGGRGGALLCETPGWVGLLGWLRVSITLGVLATGGGGVGVRGSAEKGEQCGAAFSRMAAPAPRPGSQWQTLQCLRLGWRGPFQTHPDVWLTLSYVPMTVFSQPGPRDSLEGWVLPAPGTGHSWAPIMTLKCQHHVGMWRPGRWQSPQLSDQGPWLLGSLHTGCRCWR